MNMENRNARSRMQGLFVDYHSLVTSQGLTWIVKDKRNPVVSHVLFAIKPLSLSERLESDLSLFHREPRKNFSKSLTHAVKFSEGF